MTWKPNKWIAALLGWALGPIGALYAGAPRAAALVLFIAIGGGLFLTYSGAGENDTAFLLFKWTLLVVSPIVAYRCAASANIPFRSWYTRWYGLTAIAVAGILAFGAVRTFWVEPFHAPSSSMSPSIPVGTNLLVQKWGFGHFSAYGLTFGSRPHSAALKRGDIIVFDYPVDPSQMYIKRIVGLPGDTLIYRDRRLVVNGVDARVGVLDDYFMEASSTVMRRFREKLDGRKFDVVLAKERVPDYPEPMDFDFKDMCTFEAETIQCAVPKDHYFVLGDNRDNSSDSRRWGFVRADLVVGKVIRVYR